MKKILTLTFFLLINAYLFSQKLEVYIDSTKIEFANQTYLRIKVTNNQPVSIIFPYYEDTICKNIELVEISKTDTLSKSPFVVQKNYLITSFKDSLQTIEPLPIVINGDTLFTKPLQLWVMPLRPDTALLKTIDTNQTIRIFDIKPNFKPKFTFKEFWIFYGRYILLALLLAAVIWIIFYFAKKYLKKTKKIEIHKPKEPAHIVALRQIEELKRQKLIEQGKIKEFYSELSFILRQYIENRYLLPALERTSTEILQDFVIIKKEMSTYDYQTLSMLLNISDMVKFAKFKPTDQTSFQNLEILEKFVTNTKIEEKTTENTEQNETTKI